MVFATMIGAHAVGLLRLNAALPNEAVRLSAAGGVVAWFYALAALIPVRLLIVPWLRRRHRSGFRDFVTAGAVLGGGAFLLYCLVVLAMMPWDSAVREAGVAGRLRGELPEMLALILLGTVAGAAAAAVQWLLDERKSGAGSKG
jgi:hypothetical protein